MVGPSDTKQRTWTDDYRSKEDTELLTRNEFLEYIDLFRTLYNPELEMQRKPFKAS